MVKKKHGVIIETPMEARQAEPGPSILLLLVASVSIAVIALGIVWFVFFRNLVLHDVRFRLGCGNCRSGNFIYMNGDL